MTYGRDPGRCKWLTMNGAGVSHSANRVRGDLVPKAPSSAPSGHLLPKGRRAGVPIRFKLRKGDNPYAKD